MTVAVYYMMTVVYELCVDTRKSMGACFDFARYQFVSLNLDRDPEFILAHSRWVFTSQVMVAREHPVLIGLHVTRMK